MDNKQSGGTKSKIIPELHILYKDGSTIFDNANYIIPLYQRAFAWEDKEIIQLIEDIIDCDSCVKHYYLGSLIVCKRKDDRFEVIDGQQRLTALYLLLNCLGKNLPHKSLTYECRDSSNFTLSNLTELLNQEKLELRVNNAEIIEDSLLKGSNCMRETLQSLIQSGKTSLNAFVDNLKKVRIYRIEVPEKTDLNRYFEIMNVRGEQLEQHDILKADLMSALETVEKQSQFALIWDACSDMSGYVQMHFGVKNRESLFGYEWNTAPRFEFKSISNLITNKEKTNEVSLCSILKTGRKIESLTAEDYIDEDDNKIRFKSIIGFPHFLLHVLKVFISKEHFDNAEDLLFAQLDDKKLLDMFNNVLKNGKIGGETLNKRDFAKKFIVCLLKCRFLFDKYIIKREYRNNVQEENNGDDDGVWSLKELVVSTGRKPYYAITRTKKYIQNKSVEIRAEEILMLQSCLRVSYPSSKVMHWITKLLSYLYDADYDDLTSFKDQVEKIAQEPVADFLKNDSNLRMGVNTPHIVLNYLDYVLWAKRAEKEYKGLDFSQFVFEFRNSVEHWYPQHPSEQSFAKWDKTDSLGRQVDRFGNLCLIQRNVNSKFSNLSPASKKKTYHKMIDKGSLKLRLMSKLTKDDSKWKNEICEQHEQEMLQLLREVCGV